MGPAVFAVTKLLSARMRTGISAPGITSTTFWSNGYGREMTKLFPPTPSAFADGAV